MWNRFIVVSVLSFFIFIDSVHAQFPLPLPTPNLDLRDGGSGGVAIATPDGGAIVAGGFSWVGGNNIRPGLVKLSPNGAVDPTWRVDVGSGSVNAMFLLGDDLYLAGSFFAIQIPGNMQQFRRGLAKVSLATGSLSNWNPNPNQGSSWDFKDIIIANGAIFVSGTFTQIGTTPRTNVAKLNLAGVLDASWNPTISGGGVNALASDGSALFLGGNFTQVNGVSRQRAAKLDLTAAVLDSVWAPTFSEEIKDFAIDAQSLYAVGCFTLINSIFRKKVGRVATSASGALDEIWNPGSDISVYQIACASGLAVDSTSVYVGVSGPPDTFGGVARFSKIGPGTLDTTWQPQGDAECLGILPMQNERVLLLGRFVKIGSAYSPGIAFVNNEGVVIGADIYAEYGGYARAVLSFPDNSILIGGKFTRAGSVIRGGLLKISAAGAIETNYLTDVRGDVYTLKRDFDSVYVGGEFDRIGSHEIGNLARMNYSGVVNSLWNYQVNGQVFAIDFGGVGRIYIGGSFSRVLDTPRLGAASLGQLPGDLSPWNPTLTQSVTDLVVERDSGDIFIAIRKGLRLIKVSPSGIIDSSFNSNLDANQTIDKLLLGPLSTLYIGGQFTSVNGVPRQKLARIFRTGVLDANWDAPVTGSSQTISGLSPSSEGIYVHGQFTKVSGQDRPNLARIKHTGELANFFAPISFAGTYHAAEVDGKVYVAGQNFNSVIHPGVLAFPLNGTPINCTTTITADEPENSSPFQAYQVSVNVICAGGFIPVNQTVTIEDDKGAICSVLLNSAGSRACEIASREAGTRTLTARFVGTPLLLASSDTEPHTVASISVTPPLNTAFALRSPATTSASVRLSDGSLVIGGNFNRIGDIPRRGLAKLRPDGTLDASFSADVIGSVSGLARDAADNIFVTGSFGYVDGTLKRNAAKLTANGDVYSSWSAGETCLGNSAEIIVDSANDLVVPGCVRLISGSPNTYEARLIKLSGSSGTLLPDFSNVLIKTNSTSVFPTIHLQQDAGATYLYGRFETVNGAARSNLAKIDAAGMLASWNPGSNGNVRKIILDGNSGIYIAGDFTQLAGQSRSFLSQLDSTGGIVSAFNPVSNDRVQTLLMTNDQLYVSGFFNQIGGLSRSNTAKLNPVTGLADAVFIGAPYTPDRFDRLGTALWGSSSSFAFGATEVTAIGAFRQELTTGNTLPTPSITRQAQVMALARQPDGATLIGGSFVRPGSLQTNIARISAGSQLDTSFTPVVGSVNAIKVRDSGEIYVAAGSSVTKISATGAIDAGFSSTLNNTALSLHLVSDGVIVGGFFSTASTLPRVGLVKLDYATGFANASWNPNLSASGNVRAIAEDSGGNLYFGGSFSTLGGTTRINLAKTDAAGVVVTGWRADANSTVHTLVLDGTSVYVGGEFSTLSGQPRRGIGKVGVTGGAIDTAWNPAGIRSITANALARAQDGGILVGGSFLNVGGAYRSNAAKLDAITGIADPSWNPSFDSTVRAILAGYGGTPARNRIPEVEQNIAIGGDFEFAGSTEMPGFTAVSSVGVTAERVFCSGFEDTDCRPLP